VIPFYEKLGYVQEGERFDEDGGMLDDSCSQGIKLMTSTASKDDQEHQYLDVHTSRVDRWQGQSNMVEPVPGGWTWRKN
jgi:hypothetical protein